MNDEILEYESEEQEIEEENQIIEHTLLKPVFVKKELRETLIDEKK